MTHNELLAALEDLVDNMSLEDVTLVLGEICWEKSDHVSTNWQDTPLSKAWSNAAKQFDKIVRHTRGL